MGQRRKAHFWFSPLRISPFALPMCAEVGALASPIPTKVSPLCSLPLRSFQGTWKVGSRLMRQVPWETPLPSRNSVSALYETVIGWFSQTLWLTYTNWCSLREERAGSRVIRPLGLNASCELVVPEANFLASYKHERRSVNGWSEQTFWWDIKVSMGRLWIIMGREWFSIVIIAQ